MTPLEELESRWRDAVEEDRSRAHTDVPGPGPYIATILMVERHTALSLGRAIHAEVERLRVELECARREIAMLEQHVEDWRKCADTLIGD